MYEYHYQSSWAESTKRKLVTDGSPVPNEQTSPQKNTTITATSQNDYEKYGDYVKWFKSRPEWCMHDNHPDEIEMCGGCGTTRMYRSSTVSKCYRCGFPGTGVIYRKVK